MDCNPYFIDSESEYVASRANQMLDFETGLILMHSAKSVKIAGLES